MTDKKRIRDAFSELAKEARPNRNAWPAIERRIGRSRRFHAAIIGAAAVALLVGGGLLVGGLRAPSAVSPATEAGWSTFRDPQRGWTVDFPDSWQAQKVDNRVFKYLAEGVLLSNTEHEFDHPKIENGETSLWDMSKLSKDAVVVYIRWTRTGLLSVGGSCAPQDTPLPLSFATATRPSISPDESFGAPTEVWDWHVSVHQDNHYRVTVWFGAEASAEDRDLGEKIIASISFADVQMGGPLSEGSTPEDGASFCE